ncbi:MAG TPA: formylmethanofuran dehydrogenase subunit B [Anaerolineaceae bacterium]|nr:formylmethanofuran dehydrogenase subunit B [Anaerolineaceae bacterium]
MYQVENAICAFCGCVCDDIIVTVEDDRITQARNACLIGKAWFLGHGQPQDLPVVRIGGQAASLEDGIDEAARLLVQARYPIIYGLSSTSCEAQRQAVALADMLRANIDCCTSVCHGPSGMALQGIGEPTCTLGEVKNRADLIVYWGSNPAESHPRHMTRYAVTAKGMFIPNGRKGRTIVLVDVRPTPSSRAADILITPRPGKDFELLWALRGLVMGQKIEASALEGSGVSLEQLSDLAGRMKACRFGVLFIGQGLTQTRGKHMNTAAAFLLVRDINRFTKFALIPMRGHGNVTGVDSVMAWQTGYPFGINFGLGYPRFNPGEFTMVDMLSRGEADVALVVASDPVASLPGVARKRLEEIPIIALDTHESETSRMAYISFTTATAGINVDGTVYRMDNIPLHMRKILPSTFPSDQEVLSRILTRVQEFKQ